MQREELGRCRSKKKPVHAAARGAGGAGQGDMVLVQLRVRMQHPDELSLYGLEEICPLP